MNKLLIVIALSLLILTVNGGDVTLSVTTANTIATQQAKCITDGAAATETCTLNLAPTANDNNHAVAATVDFVTCNYVIDGLNSNTKQQGGANKKTTYQTITFAVDAQFTVPTAVSLTLQHIGDIVCTTNCNAGGVIVPAANDATVTLTDIAVDTSLAMILVKTAGILNVNGSYFKGKIGSEGLLVSNGGKLLTIDHYAISASVNELATFDTLTESGFAIVVEFNANDGATKNVIKNAEFKSCTSQLVQVKGQQLEFHTVKMESNENAVGPQVEVLKNTEPASVSFNDVTFKSNKYTASAEVLTSAGSWKTDIVKRTNIYVEESFVNFKAGTYESNEAGHGGVFGIYEATSQSATDAQMTFASTGVRKEFVTTAPTFTTNKATSTQTQKAHNGFLYSLVETAFYKTEVSATTTAVQPTNLSHMFYYDTAHVLGSFASTMTNSNNIVYAGTYKMEEKLPDLVFSYTDSFGTYLGKYFVPSSSPDMYLYNRENNKSYKMSKTGNTYSANVEAGTRRRVLFGTWDETLATTVTAHIKDATNGLDSTKSAVTSSSCYTGKDWSLKNIAKWTENADLNQVTIKDLQLDATKNTVNTWYMVVDGGTDLKPYTAMPKNYFTDSSASKTYYILPIMISDNTCVDDNATATTCTADQFLLGTTCTACNSLCSGCTGALQTDCKACKWDSTIPNKNCCATKEQTWDGSSCVATSSLKTAAKTDVDSATAFTQTTLDTSARYYQSFGQSKVVAYDKQDPCATSASVKCNAKGTCNNNMCECESTHGGARCLYTTAELTEQQAYITKAVTFLTAEITTANVATYTNNYNKMMLYGQVISDTDAVSCTQQQNLLTLMELNKAGGFDKSQPEAYTYLASYASQMQSAALQSTCTETADVKKTRAAAYGSIVSEMVKKAAADKYIKGTVLGMKNEQTEMKIEWQDKTATYATEITTTGNSNSGVKFGGLLDAQGDYAAISLVSCVDDPHRLANTDSKQQTISNVLSANLYVDGAAVTGNFAFKSTVAAADQNVEVSITSQLPSSNSTEKELCWYSTTNNTYQAFDMTPVTTDTATATLIKAKTPHFTDFALLPKSSGTTPGTGTLPLSAFNVIINSSLVALIGLFALMF